MFLLVEPARSIRIGLVRRFDTDSDRLSSLNVLWIPRPHAHHHVLVRVVIDRIQQSLHSCRLLLLIIFVRIFRNTVGGLIFLSLLLVFFLLLFFSILFGDFNGNFFENFSFACISAHSHIELFCEPLGHIGECKSDIVPAGVALCENEDTVVVVESRHVAQLHVELR